MIANEGYVPLSVLYEKNYSELVDGATSFLEKTTSSIITLCVQRRDDLVRSWIFEFCKNDLHITNGVNAPVYVDPELVQSVHYFVDLSSGVLSFENELTPEVDEEIKRRFNFCAPLPENLFDRFNAAADQCSDEGDEIAQKIITDEIEKSGMTRPLLFVEDGTYRINLNLYRCFNKLKRDDAEKQTSQDIDRYAEILEPFEGYFLAIPRFLADSGWDAFCEVIEARKIEEYNQFISTESGANQSSSGRPRKRDDAHSAYLKLFPRGHARLTWDQVEDAIAQKLGYSVSAQTIRAALKNH